MATSKQIKQRYSSIHAQTCESIIEKMREKKFLYISYGLNVDGYEVYEATYKEHTVVLRGEYDSDVLYFTLESIPLETMVILLDILNA